MRTIILIITLASLFFSAEAQSLSEDYENICENNQNCFPDDIFEALYSKPPLKPSDIYTIQISYSPDDPYDYLGRIALEKSRHNRYGFKSKEDIKAYFNSHFLQNSNSNPYLYFANKTPPAKEYTILFEEIKDPNTIMLWSIEEIQRLAFNEKIYAEQHLITANLPQTNINFKSQYRIENPSIFITLNKNQTEWIIHNNTSFPITTHICATDTKRTDQKMNIFRGCFNFEKFYFDNKKHSNCTMKIEANSSVTFDSSIFPKE